MRVGVVVGGTRGIGLACAAALRPACDRLVVAGRDASAGERAVRLLAGDASAVVFLPVDVASAASVRRLFAETVGDGGSLRFAVNAAGYETRLAAVADGDEDDFDTAVAVNLKGVWLCMREELGLLGQGPGRVVNVTSVKTARAGRFSGTYAATKAAVEALTRAAALEVAGTSVTVNAVAPGAVETDMRARLALDPLARVVSAATDIPAGRLGQPREVAAAVAYLCSEEAAYVNGHVLRVDGAASL